MPTLDAILKDPRMNRLFGSQDAGCALELWVLQVKTADAISSTIVYGRATPSSFVNQQWNAPREDAFRSFSSGRQAQLIRLSLFCGTPTLQALVQSLVAGEDLARLSQTLALAMDKKLGQRLGAVKLNEQIAFRPTMHLPTRDFYRFRTKCLSVTSYASADSAALTNLAKDQLFLADDGELAQHAIAVLDAETGMEFAGIDSWRLGDLEFLVLPCLSDNGTVLLAPEAQLKSGNPGVSLTIDAPLAHGQAELLISGIFHNDDCELHKCLVQVAADTVFPHIVHLGIPPSLARMVDAFELAIDVRYDGGAALQPCFRWGTFLMREMTQSIHVHGSKTLVSSDWLTVALRAAHQPRLRAAQEVSRNTHTSVSHLGKRQQDRWVQANRASVQATKRLLPQSSAGRFFERYCEGENTGRLELAEWLKNLFSQYPDQQIAWFDPYMEDVGITLINQYGFGAGDYLIFTGAAKPAPVLNWAEHLASWSRQEVPDAGGNEADDRVKKLLAACQGWTRIQRDIRLRVIGLRPEAIHDRMILIRDHSTGPVAGFHLSNSIQRANENYPLLITPIPADILPKVFDYTDGILRRAITDQAGMASLEEIQLFDSRDVPEAAPPAHSYDPCSLPRAGDIFAWWTGMTEFQGRQGEALRTGLQTHGLWDESGHLSGNAFLAPPASLWSAGLPLPGFASAWDAFGAALASSRAGDNLQAPAGCTNPALVSMLLAYLDPGRSDAIPPYGQAACPSMKEVLSQAWVPLAQMGAHPSQLFAPLRTRVAYGDLYAVETLWRLAPDTLVKWFEQEVLSERKEERRQQFLLQCAASFLAQEVERQCSIAGMDALLSSANNALRWMGLFALRYQLENGELALDAVPHIAQRNRLQAAHVLAWLYTRAYGGRAALAQAVQKAIPVMDTSAMSLEQTLELLAFLRNPLGELYGRSIKLFDEIVLPLILSKKICADLAAHIWVDELLAALDAERRGGSLLFHADVERPFTDEVALLLSHASHPAQLEILHKLQALLKSCDRIIRRPLSSQISWRAYDQALRKCLWLAGLLAALRCRLAHPPRQDMGSKLGALIAATNTLIDIRPEREWRTDSLNMLWQYWQSYT